ncbi:DUF1272 domain-containing protein, partial [Acinetobacter baumannii]
PDATDALICSYECTYCATCAEDVLSNVCLNCGGGLAPRPIRPKTERGEGLSLAKHPASTERVLTKKSREEVVLFCATVKDVPPHQR